MKFKNIKASVLAQFAVPDGHKFVPFIIGAPGGGKSACAREIAQALADLHGIPEERIVEFNPSLREPTDILGLPRMDGECSRWLPPEELYTIRKGTGAAVLIVEELSDASMDMQNPLCRVILDRYAGQMALSEELYIVATGNRTEDRSGANRLSTKLANRMAIINYEENLDDWLEWAAEHDVPAVLRMFLKWRPALLSDFDATRTFNPTPRAWESVGRIPFDLPQDDFFEMVQGLVGPGAAAEYCGFIKICNGLPDLEEIAKHPDKAEVPTEPDVLYAVAAKIISGITAKNFPKAYKYICRMPPEFQVKVFYEAARTKDGKAITRTKEFVDFAMKNSALLSAAA